MGQKLITSGILIINKPKGITSHDVVARVRRLTGIKKVGHTGTLDPMATGVLIVCVGQATRLIEYLQPGHKRYRATIFFGVTTNTLDAEGEIEQEQDASHLTEADLRAALPQFTGQIMQTPPIFSALKKDGQPLYKSARAGKPVEVEPRPVTIYALHWLDWRPPELVLDVECSPGTYIRALARDLGEAVGTGAHLTGLIRTANANWQLDNAIALEALEQQDDWTQWLQPLDRAVAHLPKVTLTIQELDDVLNGRRVGLDWSAIQAGQSQDEALSLLRAYTPTGKFCAILTLAEAESNIWQPKKVFHP